MLKQSLIYLLLSILVILFSKYAHLLIVYIDVAYTFINLKLAPVFSSSDLGVLFRKIVSLVVLPIAIAAIPALVYRLVKDKNMTIFIEFTWLLWLIIVLSKVLIH